jgi:hypothetical protein
MRALALGLFLSVFLGGDGRTQSSVAREVESLAAWAGIASVLTHPRCLNCHQPDTPLQGDARPSRCHTKTSMSAWRLG